MKRTDSFDVPASLQAFLSAHRAYIEEVIRHYWQNEPTSRVSEIAHYALVAGGKRLRPALTLMLVESLGLSKKPFEPLLTAIEQFHTASLIFDDLPAQDNAKLRRGKPTVHVKYGEAGAQLAGISLIASGFKVLSELGKYFPEKRVLRVIDYFGTILGPEKLCLGQDMDLRFSAADASMEEIEKMYSLKTSTLIEASLIPVLMLEDRPQKQIAMISKFSYHAGIVYQIRDDILDISADADQVGQDSQKDSVSSNMVRSFGLPTATRQLDKHMAAAKACCKQSPFDTHLLESALTYFATRSR